MTPENRAREHYTMSTSNYTTDEIAADLLATLLEQNRTELNDTLHRVVTKLRRGETPTAEDVTELRRATQALALTTEEHAAKLCNDTEPRPERWDN